MGKSYIMRVYYLLCALVFLSGAQAYAQTDLAFQKPVTTTASLRLGSDAVDGNAVTRWESVHGVDSASITVDLGSSSPIGNVVIDWEAANAANYQIQGSADGVTWNPLATRTGGTFGARTDNVAVTGNHRFIRILCTQRSVGNQWGFSIFSLKVYAAYGYTVTSSSSLEFFANNAAWVDLHYRVNGGAQQNVRMLHTTDNKNTFALSALPAGASISYSFTVGPVVGGAFDTAWQTALCCSNPVSSMSSSSVRSSAAPVSSVPRSSVISVSSSSISSRSRSSAAPTSSTPSSLPPSLGNLTPLYNAATILEPELVRDAVDELGRPYLSTWFSDRGRDRHAKEPAPPKTVPGMTEEQIEAALRNGSGYDHYLAHYWQDRTVTIEIRDYVAKGGTTIDFETYMLSPLNPRTRDFRVWFLGVNTLAEFYANSFVNLLPGEDRHYRFSDVSTNKPAVTRNEKFNREIRIGDRMEVEVSQFLDPTRLTTPESRNNYYGTTFLYVVGGGKGDDPHGIVPWRGLPTLDIDPRTQQVRTCAADRVGRRDANGFLQEPDCPTILDSFPLPQQAWLGGRMTLPYQYSNEPTEMFKSMAGNIGPGFNHRDGGNAQEFMLGRRLIHTEYDTGAHAERPAPPPGQGRRNANGTPLDGNENFEAQAGKLGPLFYNKSCVGCHFNNGRSIPRGVNETINNQAIKVAANTTGAPHPLYGGSLQPRSTATGSGVGELLTQLAGTEPAPNYADGTRNLLQKPRYNFIGGEAPAVFSVRNSPQFIGVGLLEAVAEEDILAIEAANNGAGISGRAQRVADPVTGQTRLGRFGWKAAATSVKHQVAAALRDEMGITTPLFTRLDCGSAQAGCALVQTPEINSRELDLLTKYVNLLGVPARRNLENPQALRGEVVFGEVGCNACHKEQLKTSRFAPMAEMRSQTIRPYTDLLLHDMGPGLADGLAEGIATGAEWRTAPLWGIGLTSGVASYREAYMHDGRAKTLDEAIMWHDGEAANSRRAYTSRTQADKDALIAFLKSL